MANFGSIDQVAYTLGLNNWDLQQAKYNGVIFSVVSDSALQRFQEYNPLAGPTQTVINLFQDQDPGDIFGTQTANNANLPYGTKSVLSDFTDSTKRKLVKKNIPNMDGDIYEDLGFGGEMFTGNGIVFGSAYYDALYNFQTYFINDSAVNPADRNVLQHPIRGVIPRTFLSACSYTYEHTKWRAVVFKFTFLCENVGTAQAPTQSISSMLTSALSNIQNLAGGIDQAQVTATDLAGIF